MERGEIVYRNPLTLLSEAEKRRRTRRKKKEKTASRHGIHEDRGEEEGGNETKASDW